MSHARECPSSCATLTLACFLIVNLAASIAVAGIATRPPRIASPVFWFALRLLPAAVATSFAVIVFVPSYWRYEPRESVEGFAVTLTACAIVTLGMFTSAGARALSACWRARDRKSVV